MSTDTFLLSFASLLEKHKLSSSSHLFKKVTMICKIQNIDDKRRAINTLETDTSLFLSQNMTEIFAQIWECIQAHTRISPVIKAKFLAVEIIHKFLREKSPWHERFNREFTNMNNDPIIRAYYLLLATDEKTKTGGATAETIDKDTNTYRTTSREKVSDILHEYRPLSLKALSKKIVDKLGVLEWVPTMEDVSGTASIVEKILQEERVILWKQKLRIILRYIDIVYESVV